MQDGLDRPERGGRPPRHLRAALYRGPRKQEVIPGVPVGDPAADHIARALFALAGYGFDLTDPEITERAIERGRHDYQTELERQADRETRQRTKDDEAARRDWTDNPHDDPDAHAAVVYYMRIGNRVKIGYTTHLASRLASINPEELLATEPGGRLTEARRHRQFRHLHTHGEWHRHEDDLTAHIEQLQQQNTARTAEAQ